MRTVASFLSLSLVRTGMGIKMGHIGRVPGGLFLRYLMVLEFGVMPCAVFESSKQAHGFWATNDPLFRSTLSFQSSLPMIADGGS